MVSASCTVGLVAVALVHCLSSAVFLQGTNSLDTEHLVEGGEYPPENRMNPLKIIFGKPDPLKIIFGKPGKGKEQCDDGTPVKKALNVISEILPFCWKAYEDHDFTDLDKKLDECAANGKLGGEKVPFNIMDPLASLGEATPQQEADNAKLAIKAFVLDGKKDGIPLQYLPFVDAMDSIFRTRDTTGIIQFLLDQKQIPDGEGVFANMAVQKSDLEVAFAKAFKEDTLTLKSLMPRMFGPCIIPYLDENIDGLFLPPKKADDPLAGLFGPQTTAAPKKADDPFAGLFGPPKTTAAPKKADDPFAGLFGPPKTTAAPKKADDPFAGLFGPPKTTAAPKKADDPVAGLFGPTTTAAPKKADDPFAGLLDGLFGPPKNATAEKEKSEKALEQALTVISEIIPLFRTAYEYHDFTDLDKKIDECAANGTLGENVSFNILDPLNLLNPVNTPGQNAMILKSGIVNLVLYNNTFGLSKEILPLVYAIDSFFRTGDTKGMIQLLLDQESSTGHPVLDLFAPTTTAAPKNADDPFAGLFGPPETTAAPKKADDPIAGLFGPPKTTAAPKIADDPVQKSELEAAFAKASDGDTRPLKNLMTRMFRPSLQSYLDKDIDALFLSRDPFADLFGPKVEKIADLFGPKYPYDPFAVTSTPKQAFDPFAGLFGPKNSTAKNSTATAFNPFAGLFGPKNSTAKNSTAKNASDPIASLFGSLFGPKSRRAALSSH